MADTGSNSLWDDIKAAESNAAADVDKVETALLGPDYSYSDSLIGPRTLGVGADGSFGQLFTNTKAIIYYVEALITGNPPLGNQYFVNTGGMCSAPDGTLQPRYNYINNMSSGAAALPAALSELGSDFNGLIPGVADDIEGLNPLHLFTSLTQDANPPCICIACPVSTTVGLEARYVNGALDPDLTGSQCQPADPAMCAKFNNPGKESFTNSGGGILPAIPTLIAALAIMYFVFSGK
jgi:hypothetical protein